MTTTKQPPTRGAPGAPVGTDPVTADVRNVALEPSNAITLLRVFGDTHEVALAPTRPMFTLGSSPEVELVVPFKHVSRLHAVLERQGTGLRVTNKSANETFFGGVPKAVAAIEPGERFRVATTELLALDDYLIALRRTLLRYLGFTAHHAVDEAVSAIAHRDHPPLLLAGSLGSERARLARAIHEASARRGQPFVEIENPRETKALEQWVAQAGAGTLYVDIAPIRRNKASAALTEALFGARRRTRAIVAAPDLDTARAAFDRAGDDVKVINVPAVADRRGEVAVLLNLLLAELGCTRRLEALPPDRYAAVCAFGWPEDHDDLRRNAERLAAYLDHDGNRSAAARALGKKGSDSLTEGLERIGAIVVRSTSTSGATR